jgi:hypothetical protein
LDAVEARRVVRISSGWETTGEEWRGLMAALIEVDAGLRRGTADVVTA